LKSLGEREEYDPGATPKLFTEVYDIEKDSFEAELDKLDKVAFPKYHQKMKQE
jgi:hypothetical protein